MSTTGMILLVGVGIVVGMVGWLVWRCNARRKATELELARLDDQLVQCDERLSQLANELEDLIDSQP